MSNIKFTSENHVAFTALCIKAKKKTGSWIKVFTVIYSQDAPICLIAVRPEPETIRLASDALSGVQMRQARSVLGSSFGSVKTVSKDEMDAIIVERISRIIGDSIDELLTK